MIHSLASALENVPTGCKDIRPRLPQGKRGLFFWCVSSARIYSHLSTNSELRAVTYQVNRRWGDSDDNPPVALIHDSGWCLSAYPSGLLIWEHLGGDQPKHMRNVPRERILELWLQLSKGGRRCGRRRGQLETRLRMMRAIQRDRRFGVENSARIGFEERGGGNR